jgi:hypothetical protein
MNSASSEAHGHSRRELVSDFLDLRDLSRSLGAANEVKGESRSDVGKATSVQANRHPAERAYQFNRRRHYVRNDARISHFQHSPESQISPLPFDIPTSAAVL